MTYSDNYVVYHLHSDLSNGVTNIDSVTKYYEYIDRAKELGMTALAFSEHGSVMEWIHKKLDIEKAGMKYIHASEFYLTEHFDAENKIRDNYHCVLIAKNLTGVYELNRLSSKAFNRDSGNYYYNPRISIDDLYNTSDNIIITTACLGGVLNRGSEELQKSFINFLSDNKHRCFLEIQHHNVEEQKDYNRKLWEIHKQYNISLIAGTDTHYLNQTHQKGRTILQKAKKIHFGSEDGWDLEFKSYNELVEAYRLQCTLPKEVYLQAIENTNVMASMIEEFELDRTPKYPQIFDNPEKVIQEKVKESVIRKGIHKMPNFSEYKERIKREYETFKNNNAINYMLLEYDVKKAMSKRGIHCGYGRGSVTGSVIAYLLGITNIDSVKHKLNFERFMHSERVSLPDVDSDWYKDSRPYIQEYLNNKDGLYCSEIITFNTIELKGAIRDIARALELPTAEVTKITNTVESQENKLRKQYPELFEYVDIVRGTIVSIGSHPAGFIVSPIPIDEHLGVCTTSKSNYCISQINMKEVDYLNFVKLDILGLDAVGLINEICKLANIPRATPDNIPADDWEVWDSIRKDTTAIFQWESPGASNYLRNLLSDETLKKIKERNPDLSYMDLLSVGNGAIRPAGASYRDELAKGEFKDNGHPALNEMLKSTSGFLVYQEQIIEFLNKFCGYTMGEADNVRRAFAKKVGTEQEIPRIKAGFIKTMNEEHGTSSEEAEKIVEDFLVVIKDASDYLFSLNHADAYSWIGYVIGYLRYYYPYEFLIAALNIYKEDEGKHIQILDYAAHIGIKIDGIKFRKSLDGYTIDTENKCINMGVSAIKHLSKKCALELYKLKDKKYQDFYDVLVDIQNLSVNSRQLDILIKLDFFSEFGNPNKLLAMVGHFNNYYGRKQLSIDDFTEEVDRITGFTTKVTEKRMVLDEDRILELIRALDDTDDITTSLQEMLQYENEHLGYTQITLPDVPANIKLVQEVSGKWANKIVKLYTLKNGEIKFAKVKAATLKVRPLKEGSVIKVDNIMPERKWIKSGDEFIQIDEYEDVLKSYEILKLK